MINLVVLWLEMNIIIFPGHVYFEESFLKICSRGTEVISASITSKTSSFL